MSGAGGQRSRGPVAPSVGSVAMVSPSLACGQQRVRTSDLLRVRETGQRDGLVGYPSTESIPNASVRQSREMV